MSDKPRILAVETSSRRGSVALGLGSALLAQEVFSADQRHAGELLPTIDRLCRRQGWAPADIEQVYVSAGPGSFTGLRIAITAAKTLAFAGGVKIVAVPSLEAAVVSALAAEKKLGLTIERVAVVLDAKRQQIYTAAFERIGKSKDEDIPLLPEGASREGTFKEEFIPGFRTIYPAAVVAPAEMLARVARPLYLLGEGIRYHAEALTADDVISLPEEYWLPEAASVLACGWRRAQAGQFTPADTLVPFYLRRPEAEEKWEQLHPE